jgi:hypothetical protein
LEEEAPLATAAVASEAAATAEEEVRGVTRAEMTVGMAYVAVEARAAAALAAVVGGRPVWVTAAMVAEVVLA